MFLTPLGCTSLSNVTHADRVARTPFPLQLCQGRKMRLLYPLGDVDLLDAYHLCGGRVVTYQAPTVGHNAHDFGAKKGVRRGSRAATERVGDNVRDHGDGLIHGDVDRRAGREFLGRGEEVGMDGRKHCECWTLKK